MSLQTIFRSLTVALCLCAAVEISNAQTANGGRTGWGRSPAGWARNESRAGTDDKSSALSLALKGAQPDASNSEQRGITGSWLVSLINGEGFPFKALFTFADDGTFVGATQGEDCCGGNSTAQHGEWAKAGDHSLVMTFLQLAYDPNNGDFLGTTKVRFQITLNRAATGWSARWTAEDFDANGNPVGTDTGTATARRINAN